MKSFSEERRSRTEQLLLTAPLSIGSMVLGKFLAAYTMFAGATIFSSLYFLILYAYACEILILWNLYGIKEKST